MMDKGSTISRDKRAFLFLRDIVKLARLCFQHSRWEDTMLQESSDYKHQTKSRRVIDCVTNNY